MLLRCEKPQPFICCLQVSFKQIYGIHVVYRAVYPVYSCTLLIILTKKIRNLKPNPNLNPNGHPISNPNPIAILNYMAVRYVN